MRYTTFTTPHVIYHNVRGFLFIWRSLINSRSLGGGYIRPFFYTSFNAIRSYVHQFSTFCTRTSSLMTEMTYRTPTLRFYMPSLWYCFPFKDSTEWTLANQIKAPHNLGTHTKVVHVFSECFHKNICSLLRRAQKYRNFESKILPPNL